MTEHVNPLAGSVVALRKAGWSYGRIADRLGCTRNVVAGLLNRAEVRGVETTTRKPNRGGRPRLFSEAVRREAVAAAWRRPVREVAEQYGVSGVTIYAWRKELDAEDAA